jgi:hypothetical protein
MPHAMMRKTAFPHVRVSEDTVSEEFELGEAGNGPPMAAKCSCWQYLSAWKRQALESHRWDSNGWRTVFCALVQNGNRLHRRRRPDQMLPANAMPHSKKSTQQLNAVLAWPT